MEPVFPASGAPAEGAFPLYRWCRLIKPLGPTGTADNRPDQQPFTARLLIRQARRTGLNVDDGSAGQCCEQKPDRGTQAA